MKKLLLSKGAMNSDTILGTNIIHLSTYTYFNGTLCAAL